MDQSVTSLIETLAPEIRLPENYYEGLRQPSPLHVPDNILVFYHVNPSSGPHSHSRHALVIPIDAMTYVIDRQRVPLSPGNALMIPPFAKRFPVPSSSGFRRLFITFELQDKGILNERPQVYAFSPRALGELEDFVSAFLSGDAVAGSLRLLVLLRSLQPVETHSTEKPVRMLAAQAVEYVEEHLSERFSVKELAAQLEVSESYLRAVFRKEYRVSLGEFIAEKRLDAAKYCLLQSKEPLRTIAMQCGFANEYVFGAFFKHRMGVSPMRYRRGV